jgi:hypothetical protein
LLAQPLLLKWASTHGTTGPWSTLLERTEAPLRFLVIESS